MNREYRSVIEGAKKRTEFLAERRVVSQRRVPMAGPYTHLTLPTTYSV